MSAEFIDTNVLIYAHDGGAGRKHSQAVELLVRLLEEGAGALSLQVLSEFYSAATGKLGIKAVRPKKLSGISQAGPFIAPDMPTC